MDKNSNLLTKSIRKANLSWDWGVKRSGEFSKGKVMNKEFLVIRYRLVTIKLLGLRLAMQASALLMLWVIPELWRSGTVLVWNAFHAGKEHAAKARCFPWQGPPQLFGLVRQKSQKCSIFEGFRPKMSLTLEAEKWG